MTLKTKITSKIKSYSPKGNLDHTATLFLRMAEVSHSESLGHFQRVALLCEETARVLKMDCKAAFFAGLLHDFGKVLLPNTLFDEHEISKEEYETIKTHAMNGYKALKRFHPFTALCAGLHHNLYKNGYGCTIDDFPKTWEPSLIKKVLEISTVVSICDFVDAYTNRHTKIKDGTTGDSLKDMLYNKYPEDKHIVDTVLKVM